MSKVTKRKHVVREMHLDNFERPSENQLIVRVLKSPGNNLHVVETSREDIEERFLVSMPTKFRKNIRVRRGDFIVVQPIKEGAKVKAEVIRILTPQHIKQFACDGIWPNKLTSQTEKVIKSKDNDEDDLFKNTNRIEEYFDESDSDDTEDSDDADTSEDDY